MQQVIGPLSVEATDGQTRIDFRLRTPTYMAKKVTLEADKFAIVRAADGSQTVESAGPVRVTGFRIETGTNNAEVLESASGSVLTWDRHFRLRILADGTPEWPCCPQKESLIQR
jgi:hypothetical protein